MKVKVALNNSGGELDSRILNVAHDQDDAIKDAADEMLTMLEYLSVGDSITVTELAA